MQSIYFGGIASVPTSKCVLGLSGMHQKNSITFDSYNSFDIELGSQETALFGWQK